MLDKRGGAGILQNVANGSNIAFLSCYESTGRLFKARAARMQSSRVTTANRDYLDIFPTGNWRVVNHAILFCTCSYLRSIPHMYTCPRAHHLAHRYRLSITIYTMEDRHARWTPDPQETLSPLLAPGMFLCWFFPLTISRFFRGVFSVGMLATYPK